MVEVSVDVDLDVFDDDEIIEEVIRRDIVEKVVTKAEKSHHESVAKGEHDLWNKWVAWATAS